MKKETMNQKQSQDSKMILEEMDLRPAQRYRYGNHCQLLCNTLEELCLCWLQERNGTVKKSTYSGYSYCVKMHILPYFENTILQELAGTDVLSFIKNMRLKGLADTTVRSILVVFKAVMKFGVHSNLIAPEILAYCSISCRRPESRVLSVHDSMEMKDYLLEKNTVFSIAILLCRGTGMRIGELCGLKWEDVNFSSKTITIKRTISRIPNPNKSDGQPKTILYIRTPKSHTSMREIPIPKYLMAPLKKMKKGKSKYILTGKETCTEPRNVQKKFKTILKHCNIKDYNFHAMRHGFATACLEKGIDCKTVSSIPGHASTRTTMDIYVHTSLRQKQECIDAIN